MGPRLEHSQDLLLGSKDVGGYSSTNCTLYTKNGSVRTSDMEALTCGICKKILRDPMQLITCGCRFCDSCIQREMSGRDSHNCPVDGEQFTRSHVRKDKGCAKEIDLLEVDCPAPVPCGWRGNLVKMDAHLESCPNAMTKCKRRCGASFLRSQEKAHTHDCPKREEKCQHCSAAVSHDELQDHYASCPAHPVTCDFCQEPIPQRRQFEKHLEEMCQECELNCPMSRIFGCTFKGKRNSLSQHMMNSHLLSAMEKVSQLSINVVGLQETTDSLRKELKEKDGKIRTLEKKVEVLTLRSQLVEDCTERDGGKRSDAYHRGMGTVSSGKRSMGYTHMDSYDTDHGKTSGLTHMLRERTEKHDNQIARLRENVQGLQQNLTQYSIAVDELRLRQDVQDVRTTHGTFIWKIPDIRRRYRDALDRKTISLYSPPFQTSPHGYRMCVRVYLNGDGAGKGTYVSMFFVLMRSEHDDLLPFPFKQSVRFTLLNQANQAESITEAFAPDLKSQSFQKPEGEMNVASGFPKFARQTVLQDERFTRGNVIYIKAQVDIAGLALD